MSKILPIKFIFGRAMSIFTSGVTTVHSFAFDTQTPIYIYVTRPDNYGSNQHCSALSAPHHCLYNMSKPTAVDLDNDSEDMYEVEKILDKKTDRKGALYLVKWEGFSEAQATWEPEEHLQGVKWLVEDFNRRYGDTPAPRKTESKTQEAPVLLAEKRTGEELVEDKPAKKQEIDPTVSIPPDLIRDIDDPPKPKSTRSKPKHTIKSTSTVSKPTVKSPPNPVKSVPPEPQPPKELRLIRGNLSLDVAVKILGCRQQGTGIEYAVQFKRRPDVVVLPQICTHEELRVQAPWLLSQYLLETARVD